MNNELMVKSIEKLCRQRNITLEILEKEVGLSEGFIKECDETMIDTIINIANYFKTTVDEVVGHADGDNDNFIKSLIEETVDKNVIWKLHDNFQTSYQTRRYMDKVRIKFNSPIEEMYYNNNKKDVTYYIALDSGYVNLYVEYYEAKITNPIRIVMFVQPSSRANIVKQEYTTEQLQPLWLKILSSLGNKAPAIIQAEELKHNFLNKVNSQHVAEKNGRNKNINRKY